MSNLADTDVSPRRFQSEPFIVELGYAEDDGYVALRRRDLGNITVNGLGGRTYFFTMKANIAIAWVHPDDVNKLLQMRGGCCGGQKILFTQANVADVRRWTNGGGR